MFSTPYLVWSWAFCVMKHNECREFLFSFGFLTLAKKLGKAIQVSTM